MNFEDFKSEVLIRAKKAGACSSLYKRSLEAKTFEELADVIKDNLGFNRDNSIVTSELAKDCDKPEIWNIGKENTGLFNSGYRNSGNLNSGNLNSGNLNSGDLNNGDRNSGGLNSGYRNSGDRNSGDRNSGGRNSGNLNSGDLNSGNLNSGDLNSGYRNSGVFCTRKRTDTVPFFNKESQMTWDEWYNNSAYYAACNLNVTAWIEWSNMTDDEKKKKPEAFVCGGYIKTFDYKTAWKNLWDKLSCEERKSFTDLPNFDNDIFEEITGIKI